MMLLLENGVNRGSSANLKSPESATFFVGGSTNGTVDHATARGVLVVSEGMQAKAADYPLLQRLRLRSGVTPARNKRDHHHSGPATCQNGEDKLRDRQHHRRFGFESSRSEPSSDHSVDRCLESGGIRASP